MSNFSNAFDARVDVKNKFNQIATVLDEDDGDNKDKEGIGGTKAVGNGEFRDLIGGKLNHHEGRGVNDAETLLNELLLGDGIDDVELIGLDGDSFTIKTTNGGGATDFLIFEGDAAEAAIAAVDNVQGNNAADPQSGGFDLNGGNSASQFAILDLSDPDAFVQVGGSGKFGSLDFGNKFDASDFDDIKEQLLQEGGYSEIEIIDVDATSIALSLKGSGSTDTLLIKNVEDALDEVEEDRINLFDGNNSDFMIDGGGQGSRANADGNFGSQIFENELSAVGSFIGDGNDAEIVLDFLVDQGGSFEKYGDKLSIVGVDSDSFTISLEHDTGSTDIFVFDV